MKKTFVFFLLVIFAMVVPWAACATKTPQTTDWHQAGIDAIKRFKGKTPIDLRILYGIRMVESRSAGYLGEPGYPVLYASNVLEAVAFLCWMDYVSFYWKERGEVLPPWYKIPGSVAGCFGLDQFKPTTLWGLHGRRVEMPNHPLARGNTAALQRELGVDSDGLLGPGTRRAILEYLWSTHKHPGAGDELSGVRRWRITNTRLARAACALILHGKYRQSVQVVSVGENRVGMVLQKVERGFDLSEVLDPFIPLYSTALAIAHLEFLQGIAPNHAPEGWSAERFSVHAYNTGQRRVKKKTSEGKFLGQSYEDAVRKESQYFPR